MSYYVSRFGISWLQLTGREHGLSSTTRSSERWITSMGLDRTGVSCLQLPSKTMFVHDDDCFSTASCAILMLVADHSTFSPWNHGFSEKRVRIKITRINSGSAPCCSDTSYYFHIRFWKVEGKKQICAFGKVCCRWQPVLIINDWIDWLIRKRVCCIVSYWLTSRVLWWEELSNLGIPNPFQKQDLDSHEIWNP